MCNNIAVMQFTWEATGVIQTADLQTVQWVKIHSLHFAGGPLEKCTVYAPLALKKRISQLCACDVHVTTCRTFVSIHFDL